jgi:hypothetical protein
LKTPGAEYLLYVAIIFLLTADRHWDRMFRWMALLVCVVVLGRSYGVFREPEDSPSGNTA